MTDVVSAFRLVIPPNGTVNNIFFVDCELGNSNVSQVILSFPPGCSGLVGVRVEHGGSQVYPLTPGTWFILDDYTLPIPVSGQGNSGQWHVAGYNTDFNQHTVEAYFFYNRVDLSSGNNSTPLVSL